MSNGIVARRFEELRQMWVNLWKTAFGANADTSSDSVDGLQLDVITLGTQVCEEGIAEAWNQHQLATAVGLNVDAIIAPLFDILRKQATPSTCAIQLYGTIGTVVPAISSIYTFDSGAAFETDAAVTIIATSNEVLTFPQISAPTLITVTVGAAITTLTTAGTAQFVADAVRSALLLTNANVSNAILAGTQPDGQAILYVYMTSTWTVTVSGAGSAWNTTPAFSTSVDAGQIQAAYGTLTQIGIPQAGWAGLTNLVDATLGTNAQTDAEYKASHAAQAAGRGNATPRGGAGKLLALPGVTAVKLYQNLSGVPNAGRPSHSFEFVVDGGSDSDIAQTIWLFHTTGTQSYGSTTWVVTDEQGLVAQPRFISWSRPNYRYIWARLTMSPGEGFPLIPLSDLQALVGQTLETWGNGLGIGGDVYTFEVGVQTGRVVNGIQSLYIEIASTFTPVGPPSYGTSDLTMNDLDYPRFAATRVEVIVS